MASERSVASSSSATSSSVVPANPLPAIAALLGAAVAWGGIGVVSRFAFARGISPEVVSVWRTGIAGLGFFLYSLRAPSRRMAPAHARATIAFGVGGVALLSLSNLKAIHAGGAGFAAIALYAAPLWVWAWESRVLKEPASRRKIASIALTIAGVVGVGLLGGGEVRFSAAALGWGLLSGLSYASFFIFGKRVLPHYPTSVVYGRAFLVAAAALAALSSFRGGSAAGLGAGLGAGSGAAVESAGGIFAARDAVAWSALAYTGLVSTLLAYGLYSFGLKRLRGTDAAILCAFEPVVAVVGAYFVWGERLSPAGYASAAIVLAGVVLMAFSETTSPRE